MAPDGQGIAQPRGRGVAALAVEGLPDGAEVLVDGMAVGNAPLSGDLYLEPGRHVIEVNTGGNASQKREVTGIKGERHSVVFAAGPKTEMASAGGEPIRPISPQPGDEATADSSGPSSIRKRIRFFP